VLVSLHKAGAAIRAIVRMPPFDWIMLHNGIHEETRLRVRRGVNATSRKMRRGGLARRAEG